MFCALQQSVAALAQILCDAFQAGGRR